MTISLSKYRFPAVGLIAAVVIVAAGAAFLSHHKHAAPGHHGSHASAPSSGHQMQHATAPQQPDASIYAPALGQAQANTAAHSQTQPHHGNTGTSYNHYGAAESGETTNTAITGLHGTLDANPQLSQSERYRVEITTPEPLLVGPLHEWHIQITDTRTTLEPELMQFAVSGGMEAHGHGLPSQPSISGHQPDLGYTVAGMRFNMPGEWFVLVEFVTSAGPDWARFELAFATADTPAASGDPGTDADTGKAVSLKSDTPMLSWSNSELQVLASLRLPETLPLHNEGNRVGNIEAAAALGHQLFFDRGLSRDDTHACSDCHQPSSFFADALKTGRGKQPMTRNTPSIVGSAGQHWFYADGRRDSLWSQALVPLEAEGEMGNSRIHIVDYISRHYREPFEALFGPLPTLSDAVRQSMHATPMGDDASRQLWQALPRRDRQAINASFANVGKLLAAYQSRLQHAPSPVDHYIDAVIAADANSGATEAMAAASTHLSTAAAAGLKLFISGRSQCLNCHNSPRFSNGGFHNIGTGPGADGSTDFGRMMGIQMALLSEFNCRSRYNDNNTSGNADCQELDHINRHEINGMMRGAFKVPGLRGIAATAPYMHDGRYATLTEVLDHYGKPSVEMTTRQHEMPKIKPFTDAEREALVAFMQALGDEIDAPQQWQQAPLD